MEPPDYGYGPTNYSGQGGNDPFGAFDNRIRYQDMLRHQMVSQYHQNTVEPQTMTLGQARRVATQQKFQYGVPGGQDPRYYERQASLARSSYGASLAGGVAGFGMWGLAEGAAVAAGSGFLGSMLLPAAAIAAPMHFLNKGIQNSLDRRKFMHSIASDVEKYRGKLGFRGGLSYTQASQLGSDMTESMYQGNQFFSKEQQMRIHKIGISNDLLSAKGGLNGGTIDQYKKNFEDLKQTTEEVVKLLQTTVEGGMSVIKELQQKGFSNINQIKQQVAQAKTFGGFTGMGAQNMMQLGSAGAQAVHGTPWKASVGASMYQMGAVNASMIANSGQSGANAVQRVGGTAAAGAAIGNFAMNMLQSGIGTKMTAYAMNSDGSINEDKMKRLLSGKAGAYEIVTGANRTGYAMGEDRVRFGMFKEDMLNQMSDMERMKMVNSGFDAWSKQRPYSSLENKAWVYSGMFSNNQRDRRLMYENFTTIKDYSQLQGRANVERALINQTGPKVINPIWEPFKKGFMGAFNSAGDALISGYEQVSSGIASSVGMLGSDILGGVESGLSKVGLTPSYGLFDRTKKYNARDTYETLYGTRQLSRAQEMALNDTDIKTLKGRHDKSNLDYSNINADKIISRWGSSGNTAFAMQELAAAAANNDWSNLIKSAIFKSGLDDRQLEELRDDSKNFGLSVAGALGNAYKSKESEFLRLSSADKMASERKSAKQKHIDQMFSERVRRSLEKGRQVRFDATMPQNASTLDDGVYTISEAGVSGSTISKALAYRDFSRVKDVGQTAEAVLNRASNTSIDYAKVMGVGGGATSGRGRNINKKLISLRHLAGSEYNNLRTEDDKRRFAAALYESSVSTDNDLYSKATGDTSIEYIQGIINMSKVDNASQAYMTAGGKANIAVSMVDGLNTDQSNELKSLLQNAYANKLSATEFDKLKKEYKGKLTNLVGAGDAKNRAWSSAYSFQAVLAGGGDVKGMTGETPEEALLRKYESFIVGSAKEGSKLDLKTGRIEAGEDGKLSEKDKKLIEFERERLIRQMRDDQYYKKGTQTDTMDSVVKPPVLNYWNNRWTL